MMHLRLHVRHNVPRNSTFSVACNRIAVGESIVTGDLLVARTGVEAILEYKERNFPPPAIPVENEKSLHRRRNLHQELNSAGKEVVSITFEMRLLFES